MDVEARLKWKIGNELEIFSSSQNKWFKGVIDKIEEEDEIEWLTITYDDGDYEKIVDRMDFETIRVIKQCAAGGVDNQSLERFNNMFAKESTKPQPSSQSPNIHLKSISIQNLNPSSSASPANDYESNINKIIKILDRKQNGIINLNELRALYPIANALLIELDIDPIFDNVSTIVIKKKIDTNEKAIYVLNKLKHLQNSQPALQTPQNPYAYLNRSMKNVEYENNINKIVNILDRNKDGVIDLKELQDFYPDTAKALFMELDIDGSCDLSVSELKNKINTNEIAIMVLNKLQQIQKAQPALRTQPSPYSYLNASLSSTKNAASFIQKQNHALAQATTQQKLNYTSPPIRSPTAISSGPNRVPEYQEYLVKKLEKENGKLKDKLRTERTKKKMKISEVEEIKKYIKSLQDKMITETHKKDLEIVNIKAIIEEKSQSLENLQRELHLKLQERYMDVKSLRKTMNNQQSHIGKLEGMKNKLKIHLITHFNNEFRKRDEEIKRLQNELDGNEFYLNQASIQHNDNRNNHKYIFEKIEQMKLKIDEEIGQKNKIILSLQNSLSKMKTEIEVSVNKKNIAIEQSKEPQ